MPYAVVLSALIALQQPQEKPASDLEALTKELLAKFEALGPLSAKLTFESVDAKGAKSLKYTTDLHLRMADARLYFHTTEIEENKPPSDGFMLYEDDKPMLAWRPGHDGYRMDYSRYFRALWQLGWESGRERNKLLGEPDSFKTAEEYIASLKPVFLAQLEPDPSGAPKAAWRFAIGKGEKGGPSWLTPVRKEPKAEVVAGPDVVTVREADPKRTTVIDRKTGFLRSIRIDFPTGEARIATVVEVTPRAPKPEIRLPEKWKDRKIPGETAAGSLAQMLDASAKKSLETVLERWDRMKDPGRADAIRGYFAWYAGMQEAMHREGARAQWSSNYVEGVVEGGTKLDTMLGDMDNWSDKLEVYVKWGEKSHAARFTEYVRKVRDDLLERMSVAPGSDEAKKALGALIKEGFAPERIEKARPKRPAPDWALLLRAAIDSARTED